MTAPLDCEYFFNSLHDPSAPPADGKWLDLARDPSAAHRLIRLGISPRHDLPAVLCTEPGGKIRVAAVRLTPEEARHLAAGEGFATGCVRLYGSVWYPDYQRTRRILDEVGVVYEVIDLARDPVAEARILERSGGRRPVPTLLLDDRVWVFNPDPWLLRRLLNQPDLAGS